MVVLPQSVSLSVRVTGQSGPVHSRPGVTRPCGSDCAAPQRSKSSTLFEPCRNVEREALRWVLPT